MRTAEIRARRIVSLFVGDDAPYPVNLPGDIIESLRSGVGLQTISQMSLSKSAPKLFKRSRRSSRKNASTHSVFSSSFQSSKRKRDENSSKGFIDNPRDSSDGSNQHTSKRLSANVSTIAANQPSVSFSDAVEGSIIVVPQTSSLQTNLRLDSHFFDKADYEIRELMRLDGFARFQATKEYKKMKQQQQQQQQGNMNSGKELVKSVKIKVQDLISSIKG